MRVYFVSNFYDGCTYVRCILPTIYNGWWGDKTSMRTPRVSQEDSAKGALSADIVVFHRPDDEKRLEAMKLLKQAGKKVVFDNDDTYKSIDAMKYKDFLEKRIEVLDECIKTADLVTTTTETLAEEYRKLNKNVVVLKNCIDPSDWGKPIKNDNGKVRIGIVGSVAVNEDFDPIRNLLKSWSNRDEIEIVLFGLPPDDETHKLNRKIYKPEIDFWKTIKVQWQPLVPHSDYMETLRQLKLDFMVIPRADNYFNRCKSNLKFLEASILGIPVVAQGFKDGESPYQSKNDKEYMYIATDEKDWELMTENLIKSKGLREDMGREARKYVINHYNIQKNYKKWEEAYKKLYEKTK